MCPLLFLSYCSIRFSFHFSITSLFYLFSSSSCEEISFIRLQGSPSSLMSVSASVCRSSTSMMVARIKAPRLERNIILHRGIFLYAWPIFVLYLMGDGFSFICIWPEMCQKRKKTKCKHVEDFDNSLLL